MFNSANTHTEVPSQATKTCQGTLSFTTRSGLAMALLILVYRKDWVNSVPFEFLLFCNSTFVTTIAAEKLCFPGEHLPSYICYYICYYPATPVNQHAATKKHFSYTPWLYPSLLIFIQYSSKPFLLFYNWTTGKKNVVTGVLIVIFISL